MFVSSVEARIPPLSRYICVGETLRPAPSQGSALRLGGLSVALWHYNILRESLLKSRSTDLSSCSRKPDTSAPTIQLQTGAVRFLRHHILSYHILSYPIHPRDGPWYTLFQPEYVTRTRNIYVRLASWGCLASLPDDDLLLQPSPSDLI